MSLDLVALAEKLSGAGLPVLAVLILLGGWKRFWVWGYQLEEMRQERDEWRRMALRGTEFAERAISVVEKKP
jgi:hypothetical protein